MTRRTRQRSGGKKRRKEPATMIFTSANYLRMAVGCLLVIFGFTAMYLESEVYGVISLYISPIVIMAGYLLVLLAILKKAPTRPESEPVS